MLILLIPWAAVIFIALIYRLGLEANTNSNLGKILATASWLISATLKAIFTGIGNLLAAIFGIGILIGILAAFIWLVKTLWYAV